MFMSFKVQILTFVIFVQVLAQQQPDFPPVTTVNGTWVECKPYIESLSGKESCVDGANKELKKYCFIPSPPPPEPVVNETVKDVNETVVESAVNETVVDPITNKTVVEPKANKTVIEPATDVTDPKPGTNKTQVEPSVKEPVVESASNKTAPKEETAESQKPDTKKAIAALQNITKSDVKNTTAKEVEKVTEADKSSNATTEQNVTKQIDELIKDAEKLSNDTEEIKKLANETLEQQPVNRTVDNRTHYHYQYQGHTHTHEFVQVNLGKDNDKEELINLPHFIFDAYEMVHQFGNFDPLPTSKFQFDLPPNVTVTEMFHYHYAWNHHVHEHTMSVLITEESPWFQEFPWMKEKTPTEITLTPEQIEALERGQNVTLKLLQQGATTINDPKAFKDFLETPVNKTEKPVKPEPKPVDPPVANKTVEYLEIPVKNDNATTYGTLRLPLEFNDTMELPESNSTHYTYIYQFHTHIFNFPVQEDEQGQVYTNSNEKKIRFSQKPLDSVEQDQTEVVVHYHVHQHLHLHIHNIQAVYEGFLYENQTKKTEPTPKYPRVQPGALNPSSVADPAVVYVPGTITENHGNSSTNHFHYKYVEKNFAWGQEYLGELEEDEILTASMNSKILSAKAEITFFDYFDMDKEDKGDVHAHYHFGFSRVYENHTIGIREKDIPQTVHTFSSNLGASIVPTPSFQSSSWMSELFKYALILFVGYLLFKFLAKKFSKTKRMQVNTLDEGLLYRQLN